MITDPLGQLMAAMLVAQTKNEEPEMPLFGCYLIRRNWTFVSLEGKKYTLSRSYDITQTQEMIEVFHFLMGVKLKIEAHFANKSKNIDE